MGYSVTALAIRDRAEDVIALRKRIDKAGSDVQIIAKIEQDQIKQDIPEFSTGDTIKVHTRVIEGDKERIQIFSGIVIARNGSGLRKAFTVRRISYGEGVERVFPLYSPRVAKVEVVKRGKVRRARLHYLRGRQGKEAMSVRELDTSSSKS